MTNFEKYKDEILQMVENGKEFLGFNGEKIIHCGGKRYCHTCIFNNASGNCDGSFIKWLYEEAAPKLTAKERAFCEIVGDGYIVRDCDGILTCYFCRPKKRSADWHSENPNYRCLAQSYFKFIKWEDEKPWSIADLLKLEVEND